MPIWDESDRAFLHALMDQSAENTRNIAALANQINALADIVRQTHDIARTILDDYTHHKDDPDAHDS